MRRTCLILAVFVLAWPASASAQYVAAIQACSRDAVRLCNDAASDGDRLAECAKAHFQDFSEPCRSALVAIAGVRSACRTDIGERCPGLKLGAGRLLLCVKEHFSALSEPCKNEIGQAAVKRQRKTASRPPD